MVKCEGIYKYRDLLIDSKSIQSIRLILDDPSFEMERTTHLVGIVEEALDYTITSKLHDFGAETLYIKASDQTTIIFPFHTTTQNSLFIFNSLLFIDLLFLCYFGFKLILQGG